MTPVIYELKGVLSRMESIEREKEPLTIDGLMFKFHARYNVSRKAKPIFFGTRGFETREKRASWSKKRKDGEGTGFQ